MSNSATAQRTPYDHTEGRTIDLRSDTVTQPTEKMYELICSAPLGDDGLEGDPTVEKLECFSAQLLGKEAGLFVPSCTMANLLAILSQTQRLEQVALEQDSHIYTMESGVTFFGGALLRPIIGTHGAMDIDVLRQTIDDGERRRLRTSLICLETSHNKAGGTVLSLDHIQSVSDFARHKNILLHLDGARMFNASAFLGVEPVVITNFFDTVSICLSKGLSAPAGAVLVGTKKTLTTARQLRKVLGGTQRQIGILAAAGLEAMMTMRGRLSQDHKHAKMLSESVKALCPNIMVTDPETNIIKLDLSLTRKASDAWVDRLADFGVKVRAIDNSRIRCVTHRHIDYEAIERAVDAIHTVANEFS